jgi:hypothetical protein
MLAAVLAAALSLGVAGKAQPPATKGAKFQGFPVLPPIPTADPSTRHEEVFRLPTRLHVRRTDDQLAVGIDANSLEPVKLKVGKDMVTGLKQQLVVLRDGKPVVSGYGGLQGWSASNTLRAVGGVFSRRTDQIPRPGEAYTAEVRLTLFETDIPAQHMWSPEGGKYRVLWAKTLRQEVGPDTAGLPVGRRTVAFTKGRRPLSPGTGRVAGADDSQQVTKVYPLQVSVAERVVVLLQSLFPVVNAQDPYVRFHSDAITNSLIVGASRQHQRQIARVLALVDTREPAPKPAAVPDEQKQLVKGYRLKDADGAATVTVLRSLFLVVNHRVAYARFAYDARAHLLIAIASEKHQKQIATVLDLLDTQKGPGKERAVAVGADQQVHLIPIKHIDGEQLISILRSRFVVVNHKEAHVRFGFDQRTRSLILIADSKLGARIRGRIEDLDRPGGGHSAPARDSEGTKGRSQGRLPARGSNPWRAAPAT